MPTRSSKQEDANREAAGIVAQVTGGPISRIDDPKTMKDAQNICRNRAASILGKLGGNKGGKARPREFTPEKRRQIAQNAAVAKWKTKE